MDLYAKIEGMDDEPGAALNPDALAHTGGIITADPSVNEWGNVGERSSD